ncbi:chemotaxis protein CheB [Sharpea azabuensis]|uniref:chemotaxis protein CheB n=1 Tax=Sharpea azabuensis TaxID=322505 RepID=UPI0013D901D7|nr:chemotaxis protein CheB [Sharpea azabuensis]
MNQSNAKTTLVAKNVEVRPHCVVGIGASAGGLEALQQLLTFLPSDTGMAYVIIQHLSPDHKSLLVDILGKYTSMPVVEAKDGMKVERNTIYMLPPKYNIEIVSDTLYLSEYNHTHINHPIDIFLRSLASAYENKSVAVILSGTGSDGTNGIRSIKEQNGVIIVQSPESAKFDGMPRNAIATGFVDLVLSPDAIAREMSHISASMMNVNKDIELTDNDLMNKVFSILQSVTNVNYTYYKQTTVLRRIERRIVITHNRNLKEYVTYLNNNPEEAKILGKEVLIGVTRFFRDPDYFDVLKERVVKKIVQEASPSDLIRVWVAGCSTGEEAYSIAILFAEVMEELNMQRDIKIFATDLDADSVNFAGRGVYGDNIIEDVSVARLSRFFTRRGSKYTVNHEIRRMLIFAQHNVFQDPPFGKLDLISCRNLLIYFQNVLQKDLFSIFHMALKDKGFLFLGRSESVSTYDNVFKVYCANEKIFIHDASGKMPKHDRISYSLQSVEDYLSPVATYHTSSRDVDHQYSSQELDTKVLEDLMPACVVINEKNELEHSYGDCSLFITIPTGKVTLDIFQLVRNDLKIAVSKALKEAREKQKRVAYDEVPVLLEKNPEYISIVATPLTDKLGDRTSMTAIAFIREKRPVTKDMSVYKVDTAASERISDLERELSITQENLKNTVTELESVNAELQAANEELLTANEELQSSNEELQSVNEELYTVNSEYQSKVQELASVNDDMANFLSTTLVGIIMVDRDLNIRKFTEYITSEFNLADQDVGRSLRYIAYNFATINLIELCHQVLLDLKPVEIHCASVTGKTYLLRISPYRAVSKQEDNKAPVSGLVLTFVDTTSQANSMSQVEEMAKALKAATENSKAKEAFLSHMSHDMRTPMTAISGLTDLTLHMNLPEKARDNLKKIDISSHYLLNMIEEVLETSQLNAGKIVPAFEVMNENSVFDDVNAIISPKAKDSKLHYESHFENCQGRYALIDSEHLTRILVNILTNALKFTPEGGHVSFNGKASYKDGKVTHVYTISDDGKGMSDNFQKRMFLPFEQEDEVNETRDGTGLGLYIVKTLVDLLDGTISCKSALGKGTTFTLTFQFDLATDEQIHISEKANDSFESIILKGKNVLVAEDNQLNAEVIMEILAEKGVHSELARDGEEVVEMFINGGAYHYQAIIMDIMMPIKNGFDAAREIRSVDSPDAMTIPIIALTADSFAVTEEKCLAAGMNGHLSKPIDTERLFMLLSREFERVEKQDQKEA